MGHPKPLKEISVPLTPLLVHTCVTPPPAGPQQHCRSIQWLRNLEARGDLCAASHLASSGERGVRAPPVYAGTDRAGHGEDWGGGRRMESMSAPCLWGDRRGGAR